MDFELHQNLSSKNFIADLPLCKVLLENESLYPWILLVPRCPNISRIMDLKQIDQLQLLKELDLAQKILWESFKLTQLNVAAIGNKTPQLHIHIIGRTLADPAWPNTVWDHSKKSPYSLQKLEEMIHLLKCGFRQKLSNLKCSME